MPDIIIYTDGGCRGNNEAENIGGWGAVLQYGEHVKELYGSDINTSNNKMELMGAIKALEALKTTDIPIKLHSDSAYVINGITQWVKGWKKKGWTKKGGEIKNLDLWKRLDALNLQQENIEWVKVKGHSGVEPNERADQLVNLAMDEISK